MLQLTATDGWIDMPNPVTTLKFNGVTGFTISSLLSFGRLSKIGSGDSMLISDRGAQAFHILVRVVDISTPYNMQKQLTLVLL